MLLEYIPKTLDECYEYLDLFLQDKENFKDFPENHVSGAAHMTLGRWLRNKWNLWNKDKSELVKFFNEKGIMHPDDISGIIILSYHRKLNNKDIELDKQVQEYLDYLKQ